ncbi:MAG: hypothetical protein ACK4VO_12830 [Pseudobdellovibrio sp.]
METVLNQNSRSLSGAQTTSRPVLVGIITGQVAGLIMAAVVMVVFAVFLGKSPLYPVQVIGSMVFGEAALPSFHLGAFLTGLVLHQLGPALLWGVIFGTLAKQLSVETMTQALKLGIGVGIVSMLGPYLLIPFLMNALQGVDIWNREVPMFWDWAAHLVFGASFALYPFVRTAITQK